MRLPAWVGLAAGLAALALTGCGAAKTATRAAHSAAHPIAQTPRARPRTELALPAHPVPRTVRVPILTYHRVHDYATEPVRSLPDETVQPAAFAAEMAALAAHGYHTIHQAQLFAALFRGAPLPRRPVLVTVDDGYLDAVRAILPVLRRHRMVATFYVISGRLHEPGFLGPAQVRELDHAGMDIGAHTRTHPDLTTLSAPALRAQVAGSRRDLERVVGHPVDFFAYPAGAFDAAVVAAVRRAGFVLAVTTRPGTVELSTAPLELPRLRVHRYDTARSVLADVASAR